MIVRSCRVGVTEREGNTWHDQVPLHERKDR